MGQLVDGWLCCARGRRRAATAARACRASGDRDGARRPAPIERAGSERHAIRVMTGAPIPDGADSVIRVEDTDGGEDARRDSRRARRGSERSAARRGPADRATSPWRAASCSVRRRSACSPRSAAGTVAVHRRPRVAILASGDELVDVDRFDEVRRGDRIVSSNSYTLDGRRVSPRAPSRDLGIVPRRSRRRTHERLRAAPACDLLITSGGVSVGAFDFTKDVVAEARRRRSTSGA